MGDFPIGRISLHPPLEGYIQPGSTLAGTIDLRASQEAAAKQAEAPKCVSLLVSLETEERVAEQWRHLRRPVSETVRKVRQGGQRKRKSRGISNRGLRHMPEVLGCCG